MPDNDSDLMQAAHRPLVLAIDLIGYELSHPGDRLTMALKEPSVYRQIQDLIDAEAKRQIGPQFTYYGFTGDPAKRIALGTLKAVGEAGWDTLKKSPGYLRLDKSLEDFKKSFDQTPTGIWVERNKPMLYIAGSVLTIGGAIAQYKLKTNDTVGGLYAQGVSLATKSIKVGNLTLGAEFPTFKPSTRTFEFKGQAGYDFKILDTKLEFGGKVENDKLNQVDTKGIITVPIKTGPLDLKLTGSVGGSITRQPDNTFDKKFKYSLGVDGTSPDKNLRVGVTLTGENEHIILGAGLKYQF